MSFMREFSSFSNVWFLISSLFLVSCVPTFCFSCFCVYTV
jgi:hypothetical protein